ncbi:MAG: PHP domain-containing protein [Bacteroidetes bacterium]|nr:PHP domain-containing protein [Bacteroidota bacterium]
MVDLHLHSTASDGALSPHELVQLCIKHGLRAIALTDHDTIGGIDAALAAAAGTSLTVIPGVEISTDVPRSEVHILGYFVDWRQPRFREVLTRLQHSRYDRARKMVDRLAELGLSVEWESVQALAKDGSIGRPHVAQAMLERGYVHSITEAFDLYLNRNGPAYVERYKLTPIEVIQLLRAAGGLPVLAHPVIIGPGEALGEPLDLEEMLPPLVHAGLVGLEARYPGYTAEVTERLLATAARFGIITTGGTDFHGRGAMSTPPGDVWVPPSVVEELQERRRAHEMRTPHGQ